VNSRPQAAHYFTLDAAVSGARELAGTPSDKAKENGRNKEPHRGIPQWIAVHANTDREENHGNERE
jgi:hypothetical protein